MQGGLVWRKVVILFVYVYLPFEDGHVVCEIHADVGVNSWEETYLGII